MSQLPRNPGYLKYDRDSGDGSITMPLDWNDQSARMRADVSLDWIKRLLDHYNGAREELGWKPAELSVVHQDDEVA